MIDTESKIKLYLITFIVDFYIIIVLSFFKLNTYDIFWCISLLFIHFLFYISLFYNFKNIINILHLSVFIFPTIAIFSSHFSIKLLSLLFLLLIQILWIKEKRCILNELDDKFGYSQELSIYVLFLTSIISIMVGNSINNNFEIQ
tara:strand:- start:2055 stop:2489 length:435 start_codon:yes stop_codon:yes gene_type:complete